MTVASDLFDAIEWESVLRDETINALLHTCGIDADDPESWPLKDITFDSYDYSFEFKGCIVGWNPTEEQLVACFELGFNQCWICYIDGTERFASVREPRLVPVIKGPRADGTI